jgi:hypothetical protein
MTTSRRRHPMGATASERIRAARVERDCAGDVVEVHAEVFRRLLLEGVELAPGGVNDV